MGSGNEQADDYGTGGSLAGRVAIVTGSGRGVGRQHALLLAREGAKVVINDIGSTETDEGRSTPTAELVAEEINDLGGEAVASADNSATWDGAAAMVDVALEAYGGLDVLVNNAGMTRHGPFTEMSEETWDAVFDVNLKSPFLALRHAAAHWRKQKDAGRPVRASVVNTTSRGALYARNPALFVGNPGMLNYGVAKAGVATLSEIAARELEEFGVRVNTISPSARGMLSPSLHNIGVDADGFDEWDPANISPLVAWLSRESCTVTGRTFWIKGGTISLLRSWGIFDAITQDHRWTLAELDEQAERLASQPLEDMPST